MLKVQEHKEIFFVQALMKFSLASHLLCSQDWLCTPNYLFQNTQFSFELLT